MRHDFDDDFNYRPYSANELTFTLNRSASMSDNEWDAFRKGLGYGQSIAEMRRDVQEYALGEMLEAQGRESAKDEIERLKAQLDNVLSNLDDARNRRNELTKELIDLRATVGFNTFNFFLPIFGKIAVIKALRTVFGYGLREAKDIVDSDFANSYDSFREKISLNEMLALIGKIHVKMLPKTSAPTFADLLSDE